MIQKILDKKPKKDLDQKYLKIFHKYLKQNILLIQKLLILLIVFLIFMILDTI